MKLPLAILACGLVGIALAPSAPAAGRQCVALGLLPDPVCTPGDIATTDLKVICGQSTKERRHVSEATRRAVFGEYGLPFPPTESYEVDHLVSLELGGSNDLANLWPEPAEPVPGFHEKDLVENSLHREVCDGHLSLADAQHIIATDWLSAYQVLKLHDTKDGGR